MTLRRARPIACLLPLLTGVPAAWAEPGACPTEAAFQEALAKLAPRREEGFDFQTQARSAQIEDLGARYRVSIGERSRDYEDPERDCDRRARTAAVFVALVLWPADETEQADNQPSEDEPAPPLEEAQPEPPAPKEAKPAPPAPKRQEPARAEAPRFWLEGAAAVELGLGNPQALQGLGQLAAEYRWSGHFGAIAYAAWPVFPASYSIASADGRLARAPFGLGVRYGGQLGGLRASLQAALEGAWVRIERKDGQGQDSALEPGAQLGLVLALNTRVTPQLGIHAGFVPSPHPITLTPTGQVSETPRFWLGASLGCAWGWR